MSISAWILFFVGASIIWGGLIVSLAIALCHTKKKKDSAGA